MEKARLNINVSYRSRCAAYYSTLDVSYVSSVSWYFLVMFGMRGFLSLILGEQSGTP